MPILVLVLGTLIGIYVTGKDAAGADALIRDIVGNGDSYIAMMWGSLFAVLFAAGLSMGQGILTLSEPSMPGFRRLLDAACHHHPDARLGAGRRQ